MKKIITILLMLIIGLTTSLSLVACGDHEEDVAGVVKIKAYDAGYGVEWLNRAIEKFNELNEDKGYSAELLSEDADITLNAEKVSLEVEDIAENEYDLYFINGLDISSMIDASKKYMQDGSVLIEDLTNDVYKKPAINFEGKEESKTIEEKLFATARKVYKYNDTTNKNYSNLVGNYYAFPWASGASGLYANKNILQEKFNGKAPRTTNELMEQINALKANQTSSGIYPVTYAGGQAMGYWLYMYDTLFAQYSGYDKEQEFWNLPTTDTGYEIYNDSGLLEALKVIEQVSNKNNAKNGTNIMNAVTSQAELLNGKALYMVTGNWIYNEMRGANPQAVNNVIMIKMPIISALGTKLGIDDAKLRDIVDDIDNKVADATIVTNRGVTMEVVTAVKEARNMYYNSSLDHQALIPSYSEEKEIAKMFLRFLASDDFLDVYKQETYSSLPFNYVGSSKHIQNDFEKSVEHVVEGGTKILFEDKYSSPIRRKAGVQVFVNTTYPDVFKSISNGGKTANTVFEDTKKLICNAESWKTYLRSAGIK